MSDSAEMSEVRGYDSYPVHLGDLMRGERATLGKSLLDVQRDLRIKAAYIAAIESCDPSAFQTPGFIAGYVRSYARYLNLDPETTFAHFCVEAGFDGVHANITHMPKPVATEPKPVVAPRGASAPDPLAQTGTRFVPVQDGFLTQVSPAALGSVFVLLVLILGIGYGAWMVLQDIQRVEFAPISETEQPLASLPADTAGKSAALDQLYRPKELDVPVMTPRDGPIAGLDPDDIGALVPNNGGHQAAETAALLERIPPRVTEVAAPRVAIVARRAAWVRVSQADGTVLFEKILDGGESFRLPVGATGTVLRAGNSGAVYLTLGAKIFGPLGGGTSVVKNVALDPAKILAGYPAVSDDAALKELESPRVITLNETPLNE